MAVAATTTLPRLLLAVAFVFQAATAYLQADFGPAVNWFSTCMQRDTGLDILSDCQDAIADSAGLVMRALVDPQNTTEADSRFLYDICTREPLSVGHCWKYFFWQYRVFSDSAPQQGCSPASQDLVTATAASVASAMCLFDEDNNKEGSGPRSCLLSIAKALDNAGMLDAIRSLDYAALPEVQELTGMCGALSAAGCCGRAVLDTLASMSEALCLPVAGLLREVPQLCGDIGTFLPPACSQQSPTHMVDFVNFGVATNCTNPMWYHEDFSCAGYDAHKDQCPASVCEAVCGVKASTVIVDVARADREGDGGNNLGPVQLGLIVAGTALAVICSGTALVCCVRCIARQRRERSSEDGVNCMRYNPLDESTPRHPDGVTRPSAETSFPHPSHKRSKSLKGGLPSNVDLSKLSVRTSSTHQRQGSEDKQQLGEASSTPSAGPSWEQPDTPEVATHVQAQSSTDGCPDNDSSSLELGLIRAFMPERPSQEDEANHKPVNDAS